jgi:hypothetical protein
MYWFYHEYLDEERRFRVHRIEAETETEARKMHRHASEFLWVTQHIDPSVSPLFSRNGPTHRLLVPGQRPNQSYIPAFNPAPCPPEILDQVRNLRMGDVAALH